MFVSYSVGCGREGMIAVDESDATRNNDLFPSGDGTKRQPMGPGFAATSKLRHIGRSCYKFPLSGPRLFVWFGGSETRGKQVVYDWASEIRADASTVYRRDRMYVTKLLHGLARASSTYNFKLTLSSPPSSSFCSWIVPKYPPGSPNPGQALSDS